MSIRHAILGLLSAGPRHGYELRGACEEELLRGGSLNIGQVYTSLDRLEGDGLVLHELVRQAERPDKKVFSITDSGRTALDAWLADPSPVRENLRSEVFMKIAIARRLPGGDPIGVVGRERRAHFERLTEVNKARARETDAGFTDRLLLDLAALRLGAVLEWPDECEAALTEER